MEIKLPKLGEGADSGSVVSILVKIGDQIKKGQSLVELESEKAVAPIPSPAAGKVTEIFVTEGQKISVGQRILALDAGGESGKQPAPTAQPKAAAKSEKRGEEKKPEPAPEAQPKARTEEAHEDSASAPTEADQAGPIAEGSTESGDAKPVAAPSIRKMARELGIDLGRVRGSERGGRIVLQDLKAYIQRLQQIAFAPKATTAPAAHAAPASPTAAASESIDFAQWGPVEKKPMSSLRSIISQRMRESWTTIPHVTQFDEADITAVLELRKKYSAAYEAKGVRLTLTPFTLKAAVQALIQSPGFNASLDEAANQIVLKQYYHLGLAVDTEAGLIVPVIRDVDKKGMLELAKELQELAERTRARKVSLEELKGGTFTISNQGGIGGGHFTPIINKPQVAILGIGRSTSRAMVRKEKIEPRTMLPLAVSYDHRLIDGGSAARFIVQLVQALEGFKEEDVKNGLET
jgi:pyruvate dehydrogenase E2 component (dihydrolipoamide acetyltransferase)